MKIFGLISYPIKHSFSASFFEKKFRNEKINDACYKNFPLKNLKNFFELLNNYPNLKGLNVSIPHKKKIIKYIDEMDNISKNIGAVNTIKILKRNNKFFLKSYNTDVYGFEKSFLKFLKKSTFLEKKFFFNKKALILGTGGSAQSVAYVFKKLHLNFYFVSRKPKEKNEISFLDINKNLIQNVDFIVNATPIGMFPNVEKYPNIPYKFLNEKHFLFDLVYNPKITEFLKRGSFYNAKIQNGLDMLHFQAEKSWEIWTKN